MLHWFKLVSDSDFHSLYSHQQFDGFLEDLFMEDTFAFVPVLYHQKCFVSLAISELLLHTVY